MTSGEVKVKESAPRFLTEIRTSEDWWAIWCGVFLLAVAFGTIWVNRPQDFDEQLKTGKSVKVTSPLKTWLATPGGWKDNPLESFLQAPDKKSKPKPASTEDKQASKKDESAAPQKAPAPTEVSSLDKPAARPSIVPGILGAFLVISGVVALASQVRSGSGIAFLKAFPVVFLLAILSYVLAGQAVIKAYNLEYALWALLVGMIICNTVGTPTALNPALLTEFYIKTGLVLLGAEVLMNRLVALGIPGICVSWVVTPIVLIGTYAFGQRVLKMESRSLNMVISADMSVCGVSAAIATAAACKAKKEELSLAIGLSLTFTVLMMVVQPAIIRATNMGDVIGGAWLGGTIDSTGAVAAAGRAVGERALEVASTVKMIQNILIGVISFGVAVYWVTCVERDPTARRPSVMEIWRRFPKFVLGFVLMSIVFSLISSNVAGGPELVDATVKGGTETLRGWFFCLAFVSIGLTTNFREMAPYLKTGKPLTLYLCGQTLNLALSLLMAWLMFGIVFKEAVGP